MAHKHTHTRHNNKTQDGRHGTAWGIKYWNGKQVTPQPVSIPNVLKKGLWRYIPQEKMEQRAERVQSMQDLNAHLERVRQQNAQYAPAL